jgi:glyoxylase-like metal-dependent hydrolase (beta-lactamase superfamily II)
MEIVPGLHCLPGVAQGVNAYAWHPRASERTAGEPIVFDCGYPWSGPGLLDSLRRLGCAPSDVRTIAITHDDFDHTGALALLAEASGADVLVHELEAPGFASTRWRSLPRRPELASAVIRGVTSLAYVTNPKHPVQPTRLLRDGDTLPGGWIAIHTPGHTPGHTAYWHPGTRVLIAGDALGSARRGTVRAAGILYSEDSDALRQSVRRLADLEPEVVCFGHGPELYAAAPVLRRLAESLA